MVTRSSENEEEGTRQKQKIKMRHHLPHVPPNLYDLSLLCRKHNIYISFFGISSFVLNRKNLLNKW